MKIRIANWRETSKALCALRTAGVLSRTTIASFSLKSTCFILSPNRMALMPGVIMTHIKMSLLKTPLSAPT